MAVRRAAPSGTSQRDVPHPDKETRKQSAWLHRVNRNETLILPPFSRTDFLRGEMYLLVLGIRDAVKQNGRGKGWPPHDPRVECHPDERCMKKTFLKVLLAGCLAAAMQMWAFADSADHPYSGNLQTAEKIASTLYDSLDIQYQKILEPAPIILASLDTPAMMPTQNSNLCRVSVSASFIALINRLAHAKAIDQIEPGYFNRYVTTWGKDSAGENSPPLPDPTHPRYWSDEVLNQQAGFFSQMMSLTVAINLSDLYLGLYNKYSAQLSGKPVPINNFLTPAEWESGLKAATLNTLECAFGTEGAKALFEAIDKMPQRPAWAAYIVPRNVDLKKLNRKLAAAERSFFHTR